MTVTPPGPGDPKFDQLLTNIGIATDPHSKAIAFLSICVLIRLLLVGFSNVYSHTVWLPYVVLPLAIFATWNLWTNIDGEVWWSRKFHLVTAILLIAVSVYQIIVRKRNKLIPLILFADVLFGVSSFFLQ